MNGQTQIPDNLGETEFFGKTRFLCEMATRGVDAPVSPLCTYGADSNKDKSQGNYAQSVLAWLGNLLSE